MGEPDKSFFAEFSLAHCHLQQASRVARARSSLAAAILGTVRAIVPTEFLKTPDNIHRHRKVLHHPLLNNVWLKDMLGGGAVVAAGADGTALPPDTLDRALIATGAVEQLQRTAAISGLARSFADRASLRSSGGSDGAVSRLRNPITAYCGAPGGV